MATRPILPSEGRKPSALRTKTFSRLDTQPARTPVNASTTTLRSPPHDSGPVWFARPSPYGTLIHNTSPAFPAHVAVGTAVARRPPHRSRRAALPHRAPASGSGARVTNHPPHPVADREQLSPALCPVPSSRDEVPLGWAPSLHPLRGRRRTAGLVRGLHRYYGPIRLPAAVHRRRALRRFTARTRAIARVGHGTSRLPNGKVDLPL